LLGSPGFWIDVAHESRNESSRQQSFWAADDSDVSPAVLHEWGVRESFFKHLEAMIGAFPGKIAFIEDVAFDALQIPGDLRVKNVTVIAPDLIGGTSARDSRPFEDNNRRWRVRTLPLQ
jgi:hypothetical protein